MTHFHLFTIFLHKLECTDCDNIPVFRCLWAPKLSACFRFAAELSKTKLPARMVSSESLETMFVTAVAAYEIAMFCCVTNTHTHPFNDPLSRTTRVSRYQKGKTNLDFAEARDSEWQWHQLGCIHVCTSLQADNHASTPRLSFLQAGCTSCRPINIVKALSCDKHVQQNCVL